MPVCHLIGAGEFDGSLFAPARGDLIIACDAGLRHLERIGVLPDLVVGDFDSYGKNPQTSAETLVLPCVKDDTDTSFAAKEGYRRGYRRFFFHGALGGERRSHGIANLAVAAELAQNGAEAFLFGRRTIVFPAGEGAFRIENFDGYFSLFAFGGPCRATVRGAKYPFDGVLEPASSLGVSNETADGGASVTVREGRLFVWLETNPGAGNPPMPTRVAEGGAAGS